LVPPQRARGTLICDPAYEQERPLLDLPRVKALIGLILLLALIALGVIARSAGMTRHDLRVDEIVQPWRFPLATTAFSVLTAAASEAVGLTALAIAASLLVLRHRRWDAARLLVMAGSAWALALAVKALVHRPRPPATLWALRPDPTGSFPSGHDTTAWIVVLIAVFVTTGWRPVARIAIVTVAVAFALAVGVSRVYLGDHYPTDVLGSMLAVGAAAFLVWAATDLPEVRNAAARLLRTPAIGVASAHAADLRTRG
jgi:membrane-associated phospholipid phosphatase